MSKGKNTKLAQDLTGFLNQLTSMTRSLLNSFVVDDDALEEFEDRDKMVLYLKARSVWGTDRASCHYAGVSLKTLEKWRESEEFREWEEYANRAAVDLKEDKATVSGLFDGKDDMIKFQLQGRRGDVYSSKQQVSGPGGGAIPFTIELGGVPRPKRLGEE